MRTSQLERAIASLTARRDVIDMAIRELEAQLPVKGANRSTPPKAKRKAKAAAEPATENEP